MFGAVNTSLTKSGGLVIEVVVCLGDYCTVDVGPHEVFCLQKPVITAEVGAFIHDRCLQRP